MKIVLLDSADEIGDAAANVILDRLATGSLRVLGVATGSSPIPVYKALERRRVPQLAGLTAFALDEYVGLDPEHPESYRSVIDREVTRRLGLDPAKVHVPNGAAADLAVACADYEQAIADAGGIDLQILGIGTTGHIGFNEPSSSLLSRTRIKTLTPATRADNARFFERPSDVPTHCLTQGLGTILDSRSVLLVARGEEKARAVAAMIEGPVTARWPASVLQLHPSVTVLLDRAAASLLEDVEYYTHVNANLPEWQR